MSTIPTAYHAIIDPLIEHARQIAERGDPLGSIAFVGNLTTGQTYPVVIDSDSLGAKSRTAAMIRSLAAIHEADFIFSVSRTWMLPESKADRSEEIVERYGSIGASPYRVDSVSFTLETRHGLWIAQCPIKPKGYSKRKKTFGPPTFTRMTEAVGRFTDLLPIKDGAEPGHALH